MKKKTNLVELRKRLKQKKLGQIRANLEKDRLFKILAYTAADAQKLYFAQGTKHSTPKSLHIFDITGRYPYEYTMLENGINFKEQFIKNYLRWKYEQL